MPTTLVDAAKGYPQPDGTFRVTATLYFPDSTTENLDQTYSAARHDDVRARLSQFENPSVYAAALAGQANPQVSDADVADWFALWERNVRLDAHPIASTPAAPVTAPAITD